MKKLFRITTVPISLGILLKGQHKFMSQYFEVVGISSAGENLSEVENDEGIRTITVNMSRSITPIQDMLALFKIIQIIRVEKPAIVHTHTAKAGIIGMLGAWLCKVPVRLHTVAGLPLLETKGIKRVVLDFVEKLTYSLATKVYPNSFGLETIILKEGYAKPEKIKVIGNGSSNGINTDFFSEEQIDDSARESVRNQYSIAKDDFVYTFIGRIVKDKGITELVSAFTNLTAKQERIKLLIVGNFEPELDPLDKTTIEQIDNNPNIIFAGFHKDIRTFLAISKILVFPSYREGLPNVPLQACAMGVPCIVSNINGCNEIITQEYNGIIVRAKDSIELETAMERLLKDEALYSVLRNNARGSILSRYDQKYLWNMIKDEYEFQLTKAGIGLK